MINVILADDHEVFRQGLAKLFDADDEIITVESVGDGDSLIEYLKSEQIDIAVTDVSMPGPGVQGIVDQITKLRLKTKVLVLTMHEDISLAKNLLACGVSGFVLKHSAFHEIKEAIAAIYNGGRYASPSIASKLIGPPVNKPLTGRELEVVLLIADGLTNPLIAKELGISVNTVQTHRARAMEKLGARSGVELVRRLVEGGLLR